jgi:hypothetical protein
MTGSAKQSIPRFGKRWIASELTRLAMTKNARAVAQAAAFSFETPIRHLT